MAAQVTLDGTESSVLLELAEKQAIRDRLTAYTRSVDRLDHDLFHTVFHPDSKINYPGMLTGSLEDFYNWMFDPKVGHLGYQATSHQITNVTIRLSGSRAVSEAYVTARIRAFPDPSGKRVDMIVTGRYLDRWTKRDSGWMIDERTFMSDVYSEYEVVGKFDGDLPGRPSDSEYTEMRRDNNDPSYALFASLDA